MNRISFCTIKPISSHFAHLNQLSNQIFSAWNVNARSRATFLRCGIETEARCTMSHGVQRQRLSPEKEAARREKESAQIIDYRKLTEDVMNRVLHALAFAEILAKP